VYCSQCGTQLELSAQVCPKCGQAIRSGAAASPSRSDDAFLEAAVGTNNLVYYRRRFERFAAGRGFASWNWPAFFVPLVWMLYRKMWLYALAYFFVMPVAFYVLAFVLFLALPPTSAGLTLLVVELAIAFVLIPMYANALYYKVVRARIEDSKAYATDREKRLMIVASRGGTSNVAWVVLAIAFVPVTGILAAIAIPAYQDYTIRAQVSEGLNLAVEPKEAVELAFGGAGSVPADRAGAGLTPSAEATSGKYVSGVDIRDGRVEILYGREANRLIAGKTLSITPYARREQDGTWSVLWRCGFAGAPEDATREIARHATSTIEPRYLPSRCRGALAGQ
jgi:type IV pilus assembly protein PilA